ncbi:MAG TPA: hypothetical protein VGA13_02315 [Acidimicrobiales bacterium]
MGIGGLIALGATSGLGGGMLAAETGGALKLAFIPVIAGAIGLGTNWLAVKMMFVPLEFRGVGKLGWQGVIPSKAAKMASISVDKGISKLGSLSEFYRQLDPDAIALHVVAASRDQVWELVEETARRDHAHLWDDLPPGIKDAIKQRVQADLPRHVSKITHDIGDRIDELMDLKLMVVRKMRDDPNLVNQMFLEVGAKEFRFIVNSGGFFGFALGLVQMAVWIAFPVSWVLPAAGLVVGYLTNLAALRIIFSPIEPTRYGPFTVQGLFLKRQDEVAEVYSRLVTEHVLTLENIVGEMLTGPHRDRTRRLIQNRLRPALDESLGRARGAVKLAVGSADYERVASSLATDAIDVTMTSFSDKAFNEDRGRVLHRLIAERMRMLTPDEFAELLRSAFKEDEWQLIAVGAALGLAAGAAQVAFVF